MSSSGSPMRSPSRVSGQAEQRAADHEPLHLLRAFTDVEDLDVAVELLEPPIVAHAGLAEDLERARDRAVHDRRREELRIRRFERVRLTLARERDGLQADEPRGLQAALDLGEPLERALAAPAVAR